MSYSSNFHTIEFVAASKTPAARARPKPAQCLPGLQAGATP